MSTNSHLSLQIQKWDLTTSFIDYFDVFMSFKWGIPAVCLKSFDRLVKPFGFIKPQFDSFKEVG